MFLAVYLSIMVTWPLYTTTKYRIEGKHIESRETKDKDENEQ